MRSSFKARRQKPRNPTTKPKPTTGKNSKQLQPKRSIATKRVFASSPSLQLSESLQNCRNPDQLSSQLSPEQLLNSTKFLVLKQSQRKALSHVIFQPSSSFSTTLASDTPDQKQVYPEYVEGTRQKPKDARLLTDVDSIMKVFGNPKEEDPSEPIIRSILPGGIARATGIENPRLGAFITIHLSNSPDKLNPNHAPGNRNSSMKPTIQPIGNIVQAEIIRITKHEVFLALPCSPDLVSVEDRVSKNKNLVPGFRVPVSVKKKSLVQSSISDQDVLNDLQVEEMDDSQVITPLLGSVLNAFGEPTDVVVKNVELGDEDAEIVTNYELMKNYTTWVPYSNTVARNVLDTVKSDNHRAKLKQLSGILHGKKQFKEDQDNNAEYQQRFQSFDDEPTYTNEIDNTDSDDDISYRPRGRIPDKTEQEIKSDPFLSPQVKRTELNSLLQKNKQFIQRLEIPDRYKGGSTAQLLTGLSQIDMFNPIRKGSRNLFSSSSPQELSTFGQVMFKNILLQSIDQNESSVDHAKMNATEDADKINLLNSSVIPTIDSDLLGLTVSQPNNETSQAKTDVVPESVKLTPRSLQSTDTIGIYCAVGKSANQKSQLVQYLSPVLPQSIIIHTNDHDTPYTHTQAVKQATALSDQLRLQGKNVIVVYDDLYQHAQAVMKLTEPFNLAMGSGLSGNYHAVNSSHASLLDNIGSIQQTPTSFNLEQNKKPLDKDGNPLPEPPFSSKAVKPTERPLIGSSTAICLFTSMPETAIPSIQLRQNQQVHDGLKSIVDRSVSFHPHLQGGGFWPPIEVQPLHPVLPTISPVMRKLMQSMNSRLIESQHLFEYAQIQEGLGISLDFEVEQAIEWKPKLQAILMQSPKRQYSLTEQYLLVFSAVQDKILAGVEVPDIPTYKRFFLKNMEQYPTLVGCLFNIINASTEFPLKGFKRQFTHPDALYASDPLGEQQLNPDGTLKEGQQESLLNDQKTKQLLLKQKLQPFAQAGTLSSPIDDFVSSYFHDQINPNALSDFTSPLFKQRFNPTTQTFEDPADLINYQPLLQRIQHKFLVTMPQYQTEEHKMQFDSLFKANTIGKYGLPAVLDELLQVVVDDIYEQFCAGGWKSDPNFQRFSTPGTAKLVPDQAPDTDNSRLYGSAISNPDFDDNYPTVEVDHSHLTQVDSSQLFDATHRDHASSDSSKFDKKDDRDKVMSGRGWLPF